MANPVAKENMAIYKFGTYRHKFDLLDLDNLPLNLTGYLAKLQIRASSGSAVLFEALSGSAELTVDPSGFVLLVIPTSITGGFAFSVAQYDLFVAPPSDPTNFTPVARGTVTVYPSITEF